MNPVYKGQRGPLVAVLSAAIALALPAMTQAQAQGSPTTTQSGSKPAEPANTAAAADTAATDASAATDPAAPADPAAAKPADAVKTLDAVTAVGYRASLERGLELKRESTTVIDVIVAEDIADFPDLNLAESLQRVPGVSIARDAGEGRNISVRGLDAQFTRVRINGMEALSTTGGTDSSGGVNRSRGFDFNVFASELFSRITVRKTGAADLEEGSLGATVDLQAARPFDYEGFNFVVGGQLGYNDLSSSTDPRASFLLSNTWADNTFGALLSVAYTDRQMVEEGFSAVRWDNGTSSGGFKSSSPFADAKLASTFHPRIPRYGILEHEQDRLGVTASLQWAPAPGTDFSLDMLYADFNAARTENFLEAVSFSRSGSGKPQTIVREGEIDSRGNLVYGLFDDVDVRSESRYDELETEFTQIGLSAAHSISDVVQLTGFFGHSESDFSNPIQTTITLDRLNTDGFSWDFRDNDRLPVIDYGFDVTNPANWTFVNNVSEIRLRPQGTTNTYDTGQFDLSWVLSPTWSMSGGVNMKKYEFESSEERRASELAVPALPPGTTLADLTRLVGLNGTSVGSGNDSIWLIPDVDAFAQLFDIYSDTGTFTVSDQVSSVRGNNRSVTERDFGAYLQADFDADWGSVPVRGNFGVRYATTDQSSTGYSVTGSVPKQITVERDYDDVLPSLNLVATLRDDFLVRFGAAKVMSRAGLGNLTPGVTVSVSGGAKTVTGGNPQLDPFRSTNYDLSFEWYFAEESLLSLALFYKDIESFVQTSREIRPYNTSGLPDSLLLGTGALPTDDFQFNVPINTPGGPLQGYELAYQQPFAFLPGAWSNFGAQLNFTHVESEIQYLTSTGATSLKTDLTGLSKNAYNATLYYEGERLGARVSAAYRDDYLTVVPGRNNNDVEGTKGGTNIDMSASYKINGQWELTFEGLNLTDVYNDQWVDSAGDRASVYHHTGRQYFLGFRFKL